MHRVIAGLNLWALLFLAAALVLGIAGSPRQVAVSLFAAVFALLAQSAIFALFMGASKLLKSHVELFHLAPALIERTNAILLPLFRWASLGALTALAAGILAGLGASGDVPPVVPLASGLVAMAVLAVAVPREVRLLAAMHGLLLEMERGVPERPAGVAPPEVEPVGPEGRRRGLVYLGLSVLGMVLGYRYVSGLAVPGAVVIAAVIFAAACLALAGARQASVPSEK